MAADWYTDVHRRIEEAVLRLEDHAWPRGRPEEEQRKLRERDASREIDRQRRAQFTLVKGGRDDGR